MTTNTITTPLIMDETNERVARCLEHADIILDQLAAIQKAVVRYKRDAQAGAGARWDVCGTLGKVSEDLENLKQFLGA